MNLGKEITEIEGAGKTRNNAARVSLKVGQPMPEGFVSWKYYVSLRRGRCCFMKMILILAIYMYNRIFSWLINSFTDTLETSPANKAISHRTWKLI